MWKAPEPVPGSIDPDEIAMTSFRGRLYAFWSTREGGARILKNAYSLDGTVWSIPRSLLPQSSTASEAPATAVFKNRLYVAWTCPDRGGFSYTSSSNGDVWDDTSSLPEADAGRISVVAFRDRLYAFWAYRDKGSWHLKQSSSSDGKTWSAPKVVAFDGTMMSGPAATTVFNSRLYLSWTVPGRGCVYQSTSDGSDWSRPGEITGSTDASAIAMASLNDKLYIVWNVPGTGALKDSFSLDGINWLGPLENPNAKTDGNSPAAASFNDRLYIAWTASKLVRYSSSDLDVKLTFVHISDVHSQSGKNERYNVNNKINRTLVEVINELGSAFYPDTREPVRGVDMTLISGDILTEFENAEFVNFRKIFSSLKMPYYTVLGNHDKARAWCGRKNYCCLPVCDTPPCSCLYSNLDRKLWNYVVEKQGGYPFVLTANYVNFIGLRNEIGVRHGTQVEAKTDIDFLKKTVINPTPAFIVMHSSISEGGMWSEADRNSLLQAIKQKNVSGFLVGHSHDAGKKTVEGYREFTSGSTDEARRIADYRFWLFQVQNFKVKAYLVRWDKTTREVTWEKCESSNYACIWDLMPNAAPDDPFFR